LFHQLAEADLGALSAVPWLLAGGDVLNPDVVRAVLAGRDGPLVNGYGPTENTTFTACQVMTDPAQVGRTVSIGRPIRQTTVHILDAELRPVPIGVIGELYTGGDGLARGYAENPAATARAFVPDPFGHGKRLYRTGDLARWQADGTLEFIGRADDQVKIRGFRVEPAEVEAVVRTHPEVREAVVVVRGEGVGRHLAGYVTGTVDPARLREFVAHRLPEYLVPTSFAVLDRFPLNANGKVDRGALPEPEPEARAVATPPRTGTERRLAGIWRTLLPAEDIGREDSFFARGGNSLSAARLMFRIRKEFGVDLPLGSFYEAPTLAAGAAAIDAALPVQTGTIRRSRREAYRVTPATHRVRLTDDWALWRTVKLRAAGFPIELVGTLGDTRLAALADAGGPAYEDEFPLAVRRLGDALRAAAGLPALREAVAWQNRHALATGIDPLLRGDTRNSKHRQHEALLASYLQRYCAKNDTIGFFGPVSWTAIDEGPGVRIEHYGSAKRVTYLEGWAVREVLAGHVEALRPWLVPRRMPFLDIDGDLLRLPLAPPVPLSPVEAAILRACDGIRDARAVAAETGLPAGEVFEMLARLADQHRVAWQIDVPPQAIRPERAVRAQLELVTDPEVRARAEAALGELTTARDELAAAAGDPDRVVAATAELEATFTRLTGATPTRRAGALYAGRTLAYEECLRAGTVRLGADAFDGIRDALGLVLDSARWFTSAGAALYARRFEEVHRQLGGGTVPFADFWLLANDDLFEHPPPLVQPAVRELQERWAKIVGLPSAQRRIQLSAGDLRSLVASAFPVTPRAWPMAAHHSPDLMRSARGTWVLGELHPSVVTIRYASWLAFHDDLDGVRAGMRHDLGRGTVFLAETAEEDGVVSRLANVLPAPGDRRLVFGHDSCGYDNTLMVGECDVIDSGAGLRVRRRDGSFECDLLEVVGDLLSAGLSHTFHLLPRDAHTPRVTIDELVISRESWTFPATEPDFATIADERARYLRARAWERSHNLPRHVFLRFTGERKPIYADLTSLASIDLISRALRRATRVSAAATVTVVEMLPTPEEAWLTDAEGRRYTAELRMVAVDQKLRG
jgi:acyl carrier protein